MTTVLNLMTVYAAQDFSNTLNFDGGTPSENDIKKEITYDETISVSKNSKEFLLGYSDSSEKNKVTEWLINTLDAEIVSISNYTPLIHFKTNEIKGFEVQSLVYAQNNFNVRYIQDNPDTELFFTPNDPYLGDQWYIDKIEAKQAWDIERGGSEIRVAVIDVGVDIDHPDLVDNIDTVHDWDFVGNDGNPNALQDWLAHSGNAHGTKCAGIIAAVQNNNRGVAGLASISLVNYRVGWVNWFGSLETSITKWIDAIYKAVNEANIDIISISLGTTSYNPDLYWACQWAWVSGVLIVASAGNDNWDLDSSSYNLYPAEFSNVMCVAATDENDVKSSFSNYGDSTVDICAPGEEDYTTSWKGTYSDFTGTSASAPVVAGVAALILSKYHCSLDELWWRLAYYGNDIFNPQIQRRVNAYQSVAWSY